MNNNKIAVSRTYYTPSQWQQMLADGDKKLVSNFGLDLDQELKNDPLYRDWDDNHRLFTNVAYDLYVWHQEQFSSCSASKAAGRPRADILLIFMIFFFKQVKGCSLLHMMHELKVNLFLQSIIFSHLGRVVVFPKRPTIVKYLKQMASAELFSRVFEASVQNYLRIASENLEPAGDIYEDIQVGQDGAIDATFLTTPGCVRSKEEFQAIKDGNWEEKFANLRTHASNCQKDPNTTYGAKYGVYHFGYKATFVIDVASKLVVSFRLCAAHMHDVLELVPACSTPSFPDTMTHIWADSGYISKDKAQTLKDKGIDIDCSKRGYKNKPLTDEDIAWNSHVSHYRIGVEHCFSYLKNAMNFRIYCKSKVMALAEFAMVVLAQNSARLQAIIDKRVHRPRKKSSTIWFMLIYDSSEEFKLSYLNQVSLPLAG